MKKRTILGLCLSIFSFILFSCGIQEHDEGSATFSIDTAKLAQRSIKAANFDEEYDEKDFEEFAEYVNFELSAIVHYEIDGKAKDYTESLWTLSGKEAFDTAQEMKNMSDEESDKYFYEKFGSKKITIDNLPVGKVATFRMKIRQKITLNTDALTEEVKKQSILTDWAEWVTDEYLAISKEPVTARIGTDSEITIKLTEYDEQLDWAPIDRTPKTTPETSSSVSWTLTGTFPSEWSSDLEFLNGEIYIYKKTSGTWNLVDTVKLSADKPGFTVTQNRGTGSGTTTELSAGDTAMLTIRMMYASNESAGEHTFAGWSKEVTCASGKNVFDMDEVSYIANFWGNPAPTTMASVLVNSENEITSKYGTITVFTTKYSSETGQSTSTELLTKEIELSDWVKTSSSKDNSGYSSYQATYTFSDISAFASIEEGANLEATLILYEDAARENQVNEVQGYCRGFYENCNNLFDFYIHDSSSGSEQPLLNIELCDESGNLLSLSDSTYYYALMITENEIEDITNVEPLYKTINSTNSSSLNFSGEEVASIVKKENVYVTLALFDTISAAQTASTTGNLESAKYSVKNFPFTITAGSTFQYIRLTLTQN